MWGTVEIDTWQRSQLQGCLVCARATFDHMCSPCALPRGSRHGQNRVYVRRVASAKRHHVATSSADVLRSMKAGVHPHRTPICVHEPRWLQTRFVSQVKHSAAPLSVGRSMLRVCWRPTAGWPRHHAWHSLPSARSDRTLCGVSVPRLSYLWVQLPTDLPIGCPPPAPKCLQLAFLAVLY